MTENKNKILVELTKTQRDLLSQYSTYFDNDELVQLISISLLKNNKYQIHFTLNQLDELIDIVYNLSEYESNPQKQAALDRIADCLEEMLPTFDDEPEDDYAECSQNTGEVFTLKVALLYESDIWRSIAIRGGQTLHDLHEIIFTAFDRDDQHLYSFYIPDGTIKNKNIRIIVKSGTEYTHPFHAQETNNLYGRSPENAAAQTIESLGLEKKQKLFYLFDFGDEWWHEITVEEITGTADHQPYPRILKKNGQSPPQYDYPDDEVDEDDWQ
jgi:hypothetical protein